MHYVPSFTQHPLSYFRVFLRCPLGFLSFSFRFATHRVIRYNLKLSDFDIRCPLGFLSFSFCFATHRVICYSLKLSDFEIHRPLGGPGGDKGIRTLDPLLAGQVLSQLSYTPIYIGLCRFAGGLKWIRTTDLALIRRAL